MSDAGKLTETATAPPPAAALPADWGVQREGESVEMWVARERRVVAERAAKDLHRRPEDFLGTFRGSPLAESRASETEYQRDVRLRAETQAKEMKAKTAAFEAKRKAAAEVAEQARQVELEQARAWAEQRRRRTEDDQLIAAYRTRRPPGQL